jgi:hypothetical protein
MSIYAEVANLKRKMRGSVTKFEAEVSRWRTKIVKFI